MGQKTHPYGFRLGYTRPWKSRWSASKYEFGDKLVEDQKIKRFTNKKLAHAGISKIEIERRPIGGDEELVMTISTERPGLIIGPKGRDIDALRAEVAKLTKCKVNIKINEVAKPSLDAKLVSANIAQQLERRGSFRRVMQRARDLSMESGAMGIKIRVAGRLNGADIARAEVIQEGALPLSTLDADIDYGYTNAITTYGDLGIKVWIYKGILDMSNAEERSKNGPNAKAS